MSYKDYIVCPETAREDWVPPDSRIPEFMMRNTGEDSAHSFVYFPKTVITTPKGKQLHCLVLPPGVQLYKGIFDSRCAQVNDPASEGCTKCQVAGWYSDYRSVFGYAGFLTDRIYAFETTRELLLVNYLDTRNLSVILDGIIERMEANPFKTYTNKYDLERSYGAAAAAGTPPTNEPNAAKPAEDPEEKKQKEQMRDLINYFEILIETTGFPVAEDIVKKYIKVYEHRLKQLILWTKPLPSKNPPDPNPEHLALVEAEFGNQSVLNRFSMSYNDELILPMLKDILGDTPIDGYYSPQYYSRSHGNENYCTTKPRYFFHREIALFKSKGLLKRNPTSVLNGCVIQKAQANAAAAAAAAAASTAAKGGRRTRRRLHKRC